MFQTLNTWSICWLIEIWCNSHLPKFKFIFIIFTLLSIYEASYLHKGILRLEANAFELVTAYHHDNNVEKNAWENRNYVALSPFWMRASNQVWVWRIISGFTLIITSQTLQTSEPLDWHVSPLRWTLLNRNRNRTRLYVSTAFIWVVTRVLSDRP